MNRPFSIYLDVLRFTAACLVFVSHSNSRYLSQAIIPVSGYGHSAVIVFFVLSGFVIAYVADTKERDWVSYSTARLSRIYSVAVPAVALTIGLDWIGRRLYPEIYDYPFDQIFVRVASSLAMLNEVWFISITSFSNVPYWSICYEVWYYAIFGVIVFAPPRFAAALSVLIALALGPKLILLAPIWAAGVLLYRWHALRRLSLLSSWIMVFTSVIGIYWFHAFGVTERVGQAMKELLGVEVFTRLTWSNNFLSDYVLGALVFLNLAGMRRVAEAIPAPLLLIERPVRFAATYTLTLYLFHQPLILFWTAAIRGNPKGWGFWASVMLATTACVLLIGYVTENRRYILTAWLRSCLTKVVGMYSPQKCPTPGSPG